MSRPEHLSNSQLGSFLNCGKSYQLSRIQDAPQTPSVWLPAGVALHECIYEVNRMRAGLMEPFDIGTRFRELFTKEIEEREAKTGTTRDTWKRAGRESKANPNKEDCEFWMAEGSRQCNEYLQWLIRSGWSVVTHDLDFLAEFETSAYFGIVQVKGFLDAVMTMPDGRMVIVDYKSGSRIPSSQTQLGIYSAALRRTKGMDINHGAFFMTRKAEMTEAFDLTRYTPEYFDGVFEKTKFAMDNDIFIPNPGDACRICDVSAYCYAVGGAKAWELDPDHPQYKPNKISQ